MTPRTNHQPASLAFGKRGACALESAFYILKRINSLLSQVSSSSNTGSIRDGPYWAPRKNSLELIELSGINKVSLI